MEFVQKKKRKKKGQKLRSIVTFHLDNHKLSKKSGKALSPRLIRGSISMATLPSYMHGSSFKLSRVRETLSNLRCSQAFFSEAQDVSGLATYLLLFPYDRSPLPELRVLDPYSSPFHKRIRNRGGATKTIFEKLRILMVKKTIIYCSNNEQ